MVKRTDVKKCPHCELTKTKDAFYIHKRGEKKGHLFSWCKLCECERYKHNKEQRHTYYLAHKTEYKARSGKWLQNNKLKWRDYMRLYRMRNEVIT